MGRREEEDVLRSHVVDEDSRCFLDSEHGIFLDCCIWWKDGFGESKRDGSREEIVL